MMSTNIRAVGAESYSTQALKSTPITILYKLSNPFSSPLPVPKGGTGLGSFSKGDLLFGESTVLSVLPIGTDGQVLMTDSIKPYWSDDLNIVSKQMTTITNQEQYVISNIEKLLKDSDSYSKRLSNVSDLISQEILNINSLTTLSSNQDQQILNVRSQADTLQSSLFGVTGLQTDIQAQDENASIIEKKIADNNTYITDLQNNILQAQDNIRNLSSNINSYGQYKNKIINGNFAIWQRNTVFIGQITTGTAYLTADRWAVSCGSNVTVVMQKTQGIIGTGDSTNKIVNALHISFSGAGTKTLRHSIENARTLDGQQCTLSFWAKAPAFTLTTQLKQIFTTTTNNTVFSTTFNITEQYRQFTYTFTLPSIAANTLMTNNNCLQLSFSSNANWSIDICNVQLEQGPISTFEYRPFIMEQLLCQRYYETGYAYLLEYTQQDTIPLVTCSFKTNKRTVPTVKTNIINNSSFTNTVNVFAINSQQLSLGCKKNTYSTDGSFNIQWSVDCEII